MNDREKKIQCYFNMWLCKDADQLDEIFAPDIHYIECYGPEYRGLKQIKQWFAQWNDCGTVLIWEIKQMLHQQDQTVAEWYFRCDYNGSVDGFDGVSLIKFNEDGKICSLKEFQSKAEHYMPYTAL